MRGEWMDPELVVMRGEWMDAEWPAECGAPRCRGAARKPPAAVLDQLKTLNQNLHLGNMLCRSRSPDFLLNIIQRQVTPRSHSVDEFFNLLLIVFYRKIKKIKFSKIA